MTRALLLLLAGCTSGTVTWETGRDELRTALWTEGEGGNGPFARVFLSTGTFSCGLPSHDDPQVHELVQSVSRDRSVSEVWEGDAELELFDAPGEEHTLLRPLKVGRGYRFTFAYTVDDLRTVKEL